MAHNRLIGYRDLLGSIKHSLSWNPTCKKTKILIKSIFKKAKLTKQKRYLQRVSLCIPICWKVISLLPIYLTNPNNCGHKQPNHLVRWKPLVPQPRVLLFIPTLFKTPWKYNATLLNILSSSINLLGEAKQQKSVSVDHDFEISRQPYTHTETDWKLHLSFFCEAKFSCQIPKSLMLTKESWHHHPAWVFKPPRKGARISVIRNMNNCQKPRSPRDVSSHCLHCFPLLTFSLLRYTYALLVLPQALSTPNKTSFLIKAWQSHHSKITRCPVDCTLHGFGVPGKHGAPKDVL